MDTISTRLLRILRFHAHDLNLVPSVTAYMHWGKGPKQRLRITKTGDPGLEETYARHFVWPGKGPFHPPVSKEIPPLTCPGGSVLPRAEACGAHPRSLGYRGRAG
jgi:hypothetical protein